MAVRAFMSNCPQPALGNPLKIQIDAKVLDPDNGLNLGDIHVEADGLSWSMTEIEWRNRITDAIIDAVAAQLSQTITRADIMLSDQRKGGLIIL